jgi:glycosyltransferase involved in cell wall biosynthesis
MKLLAVYSKDKGKKTISPVDRWRIQIPLQQLKKNTDWDIYESDTFIEDIEKYKDAKDFTQEELEKAGERLGTYDVVWTTYYTNPSFFALSMAVNKLYGTKFIYDVDDDWWTINPDNPVWNTVGDADAYCVQKMLSHAPFVTTTNEHLADVVKRRADEFNPEQKRIVIPNLISLEDHEHERTRQDNKIIIGYWGGASHYADLHESGVLPAIKHLVKKYPNVEFESCGQPIDKYKVKGMHFRPGTRGLRWYELYKTLQYDIAIAPLLDNKFNWSKSDIKWQEAAIMGAPLVASRIGPYLRTIKDGEDGLLVRNSKEAWVYALEQLILDEELRKKIAKQAKDRVVKDFAVENNWQLYKNAIEGVKNAK